MGQWRSEKTSYLLAFCEQSIPRFSRNDARRGFFNKLLVALPPVDYDSSLQAKIVLVHIVEDGDVVAETGIKVFSLDGPNGKFRA
jgi:hypothetical protein